MIGIRDAATSQTTYPDQKGVVASTHSAVDNHLAVVDLETFRTLDLMGE